MILLWGCAPVRGVGVSAKIEGYYAPFDVHYMRRDCLHF